MNPRRFKNRRGSAKSDVSKVLFQDIGKISNREPCNTRDQNKERGHSRLFRLCNSVGAFQLQIYLL